MFRHDMTARLSCFCTIAMMLVMVSGCSSLKVMETWHKPAGQGQPYHKLMILGIGHDENVRKMFENIVVDELSRGLVSAVASHTILPDLDKTNREGVIAAVKAAGCDAVLTTRAMSVGDSSVTQQGPNGTVGVVYGAAPVANRYNFLKATLQSSLFDAGSTELVWTATVKTVDADREARVSRDMAKFFLEQLRRDGFL